MSPNGMRAVQRPFAHMLAPPAIGAARERFVDDAHLRVDFQGARLHAIARVCCAGPECRSMISGFSPVAQAGSRASGRSGRRRR